MSYDSNTKIALLNERFSKLLLVALSAGYSQSHRSDVTNLLHNYRGVGSETRYNEITNNLTDAFYLAEVSSVYYDGTLVTFGTSGWYRDIKFILDAQQRKLRLAKSNGQGFIDVSLPSSVSKSAEEVHDLAKDILGQSTSFYAIPTPSGYDLERKY